MPRPPIQTPLPPLICHTIPQYSTLSRRGCTLESKMRVRPGVTGMGDALPLFWRGGRGLQSAKLPSMLPLLSSPLAYFFPCIHLWALCHMAPIGLAASCGVGTSRLQRPSLRAGAHTRHPMLSASFDESGRPVGGDPISPTASLQGPESSTGRLHQHQGRSLTQHRNTAYASLRTAPSGKTPVLRKRHSAMSNFRATATIPMRLKRLPPPPKRSRNQQLRALSGW